MNWLRGSVGYWLRSNLFLNFFMLPALVFFSAPVVSNLLHCHANCSLARSVILLSRIVTVEECDATVAK
jgi:hypothetical protein